MIRKVFPSLGIILFLINYGCNKKNPAEQVLQKDSTLDLLELSREGVIEYDLKAYKTIGVDPKNSRKVISQVDIKYPELKTKDKKLKKSINAYVDNYIIGILKSNMNEEDTAKAQSINSASRAFIKSCKSDIIEIRKENPDWEQVWFCEIIGNVEMHSDKFFTLRFKHNAFTGGAHGEYGESYATFNLKTGKVLCWQDIIAQPDKFKSLAELRFKQVNGIPPFQKLSEEEGFFFENNTFQLPENFGLSSDGLILYYQPYEVAPYSFGATIMHFKYFEIMDYLNPGLFEEAI